MALDGALNTLSSAFDSAWRVSALIVVSEERLEVRANDASNPRRGEPRLTGTTGRLPADTYVIRLSSVIDQVSSHSARQWPPM